MDDLAAALASNRGAAESAIPAAEAELVRCRARCQELEESDPYGPPHRRWVHSRGHPTLGDASRSDATVLGENPDGLRAPEIADEIERRGLYHRRDGKPAGGGQVHSRVNHYPDRFTRIDKGRIRLCREDD